ncbi:FUSC family protein [Xylophilus sp.]|uniref:FUSC family protein n=1 Tax=Xylophilus sp. TaxID=2653893 RepID=UPI0013B808F0|nr:FUSC family membrane protein [Xylophilus sp.]KAF1045748.1 MAG: Inner membrane protein YccS [Xylophilus sp.]
MPAPYPIRSWLRRRSLGLPAYAINGIGVTLGVAVIQGVTSLLGGPGAALLAASGAVCTSLADLPNPQARARLRLVTAALVACTVSFGVDALRPWPLALGAAVVVIAFLSAMALAWGQRAGPVSFVGILAFIFAMAAPPLHGLAPLLERVGWTAVGAVLYVLWALAASTLMQRRYRSLALASVLQAVARLLRTRAALVVREPRSAGAASPLQDWIQETADFDEKLQVARDLLFAAPDSPAARRQTALLLLLAIDLRETLLVSELDRELVGYDAAGMRVREAMAAQLAQTADVFRRMYHALRYAQPWEPPRPGGADPVQALAEAAARFAEGDARAVLVSLVLERSRHMRDDLARMQALMQGGPATVQLDRAQLQAFVSVEGWPLAALKRHTTLRSPILRHALRAAVALGAAYFIALALPWAAHPQWLVLSVAVVLRGTLEQTLARRNARIAGTLIGCALVLLLAQVHTPLVTTVVFLAAVGTAHAFAVRRYLVTSIAATLMALLQAHLAAPEHGFSVSERLADTLLGAALAWGFSYVLPSWERHGLVRVVGRLRRALGELAALVVQRPGTGSDVPLRLARREVYDALNSLAAAAQRTRAEPARVRLPAYTLAGLLLHSQALLAHLAAVRSLLARHAEVLDADGEATDALLADAAGRLQALLSPPPRRLVQNDDTPAAAIPLPPHPAAQSPTPWLHRQLAVREAARVAQSASAAIHHRR